MPSAQAHLPDGDGGDNGNDGSAGRLDERRPLLLEDVDRALQESAVVAKTGNADLVRAWRSAFTRVLETLTYARSVLADDAAILRHRLDTDAPSSKEIVDDLPRVLADRPQNEGGSVPDPTRDEADPGLEAVARADAMLAVHANMATVDYTTPEDVRRVLALIEEQLAALETRQEAVEGRLQELREAILRHYEEGTLPTENWPA